MEESVIKINDFELSVYGAAITAYEISPYEAQSRYFCPPSSIVPVMLSASKTSRKITLDVEFFGDYELDVAENQSNFTRYVEENEIELFMPDGFFYHCVLSSVGAAQRVAPFVYTTKYEFVGYKHKEKVVAVANSGNGTVSLEVKGNQLANAIFTVSGSGKNKIYHTYTNHKGEVISNQYEVECSNNKVHINGIDKTVFRAGVNVYGSMASFTKFPELYPGTNRFAFELADGGSVTLRIEYYPIFA